MRTRAIEFILRHPVAIVVTALLGLVFSGGRLLDVEHRTLRLAVDTSLTGLLPVGGAALELYADTAARFGSDDVLFVAWQTDDLFSAEVLTRVKRLARRLERIDGVRTVDSLAAATRIHADDDIVEVTRMLGRLPQTAADREALAAEVLSNPLYGTQLVAPGGQGTLFVLQFDTGLESERLADALAAIRTASREEAGGIADVVTGPVVARLEIGRVLFADMRRALPLAVLVTALVAAVTLRSVRGVVLPLAAIGSALAATLALFVAHGMALNFVTVIMPPVVFVVGFALAVHVISAFDAAYRERGAKSAALREALHELWQPLCLTAFTTAVGFGSLATSNIDSIRVFGLYTALGTLMSWGAALFLLPACLLLLPARVVEDARASRLSAFAPRLARFDIRYRRAIFAAAALLALASLALATRIEVSTDYLGNFAPDSPLRRDFDQVRSVFGGANPLQIVIRSDLPGAFQDPVHLATLDALERALEHTAGVGTVTSLIDFIAVAHRALEPGEAGARRVPDTRDAVEDILLLAGGPARDRLVDRRFTTSVMHVTTPATSTRELAQLIARIETRLAELPSHLHGAVTGSTALLAQTLDDIVRGQLLSLGGALLVIYAILLALFGSARVAALALLPNALPIVAFFGVLGASGITLNLATSLVAAVVLGIAVDDSIHFLSRFNAEARRAANEEGGIEAALTSVIRPVSFTTLALCCGFLTLTFGELRSQVEFGALAAVVLLLAWIIDLTFTPAISNRLRFVTLWEVLTVDLGASPQTIIPLFRGLSHRQARIAAILGHVETCRAGTRVITLGDQSRDIHVVIDGELAASVPRDDGDALLRTLRRGDLIGEIALFRGTRSANVDAITDVRLVRLDEAALQRIAGRYPRIATVIYRNLGAVMAERLADATARL